LKPLSFVIITYNRPGDALELLRNITTLNNAAELLEDVIIVNNASTESYDAVKQFIAANTQINFRFIDAPANLGVAKGRNLAIGYAKAPILILLDDDAELGNKDALENIVRLFASHTNEERPLGIISFKVLYFSTRAMQVNALPHKRFNEYKDKSFFYTYFFAGGAHAIKREVLEKVGNYPEDFFYGMEEYDLSYRILDNGYSIAYSDSIIMLHKESPLGRKPKKEKLLMMWLNKSKVAWRYLPRKYFISTAFMWSLEYLKQTGWHIGGFIRGWSKVFSIPRREKRMPVHQQTLHYLAKTKARLWY
jgi:GT2 family glycosyltransferase